MNPPQLGLASLGEFRSRFEMRDHGQENFLSTCISGLCVLDPMRMVHGFGEVFCRALVSPPDLNQRIFAPSEQAIALVEKRQSLHEVSVRKLGCKRLSGFGIPNANPLIVGQRRQPLAVVVEYDFQELAVAANDVPQLLLALATSHTATVSADTIATRDKSAVTSAATKGPV